MDEGPLPHYWHVEFYDKAGHLEHNDIISGFEELCEIAQGRVFIICEPATAEEYLEQQRMKAL